MIQTQEVSITYQGDGVQTSFAYPYAYRSSEDIKGYLINEEGYEEKITTNYRYDTVENKYIYPLQGEPLQAPWRIKLIRETPQQQNEKLPNKLPFSMIEKSLDWIIMILQEIGTRMNFLWHIRNDCKQSETNAKNSANAAAKSEENAANSQDMAQKWAMSPTSPDGNIDENSPTRYTQSAKSWANLSKQYLINAQTAFDGLLTENEWLGDMIGYGVVKGSDASIIDNKIVHINSGVVVLKTGDKYKISEKAFTIEDAGEIPRYDAIFIDNNGKLSYIKGNQSYIQEEQKGEATYKLVKQPIDGNWLRFGSINGGDLKPTKNSSVAGKNGYFLIGSTIAETVQNLLTVFNSINTLTNKWEALSTSTDDTFIIREKVAGGNTPRNFMKETEVESPIVQLEMKRSVQPIISPPMLPVNSIPVCTIKVEKGKNCVLKDSRYITPNISPHIANVRAYGAVGDGVFNDSDAIQKAFDTGKSVYFPAGIYRLDKMIERNGNNNIVIDASQASIEYTGTEYAFKLGNNNNSVYHFNVITAFNGGGIWLCGDNKYKASAYTDIWFKKIDVETNGVYVSSNDWVWMNEIYLHCGVFTRGDSGFFYLHNSRNGTSHWIFDYISVEGVEKGFCFEQGEQAKENNKWFDGFEFNNGRYAENDNLITVKGKATNFLIITNTPVKSKYLQYNEECTLWRFLSTEGEEGKLIDGIYFYCGAYQITSKEEVLNNLNNIKTIGTYSVSSYNIAKEMINSPITDSPFYIVMRYSSGDNTNYAENMKTQVVCDWGEQRKYARMYNIGEQTWGNWNLIYNENSVQRILTGKTTQRINEPKEGMMYFDTTLKKPIWYTDGKWVDANGINV